MQFLDSVRLSRRLMCGVWLLAAPIAGYAQGAISVSAGENVSRLVGRGAKFSVPIQLEMGAATGGTNVATLTTTITWDATRLTADSLTGTAVSAAFGLASGTASFALNRQTNTTSNTVIGTIWFTSSTDPGGARLKVTTTKAVNLAGTSVLPYVLARNLDVCAASLEKWGDANGDNAVNIVDAQQIARSSVGLSVAFPDIVALLGDVTGDGVVNIVDAQQIARFSVALSAAARVNSLLFSQESAASVTLATPSASVFVGTTMQLTGTALDVHHADLSGCALLSWTSSNTSSITVNSAGGLVAVGPGSSTITASIGALAAQVTVAAVSNATGGNLVIAAGNNQVFAAGQPVAVAPSVTYRDAANSPVSGVPVMFAATSGGGSVTGASSTTGPDGTATVGSWTLGPGQGSNILTVTIAGTGVTGNPAFVSATALLPASIVATSADGEIQSAGSDFPTPLAVVVRDNVGTPIQGARVLFAQATGGGGFVGGTSVFRTTDANGKATVNWQAGNAPGTQVAAAALAGLQAVTFTGTTVAANSGLARCMLTTQGTAYCWGANNHGQIGDATTITRTSPTAVSGGLTFTTLAEGSADHACGLTADGHAYCWGFNTYGQVGDNTFVDRTAPVPVQGGFLFTKIAVGSRATCGISTTASLLCWGWTGFGLFGDGVLGHRHQVPTAVNSNGVTFTTVALGDAHACAIAASGAAYCWGLGTRGQLGDGTFLSHSTPAMTAGMYALSELTLGAAHSCARLPTKEVQCWGAAPAIGRGAIQDDADPGPAIGSYASLSAAGGTTCGVSTTGVTYCWGSNAQGQLGDNTTDDHNFAFWRVEGDLTFASVNLRPGTSCARLASGKPYCWGQNDLGQIGAGTAGAPGPRTPVPVLWVEATPP